MKSCRTPRSGPWPTAASSPT